MSEPLRKALEQVDALRKELTNTRKSLGITRALLEKEKAQRIAADAKPTQESRATC